MASLARSRDIYMDNALVRLLDAAVWTPALERFGAVTQLTVALYDVEGHRVCGPVSPTPLFATFDAHGYDPGLFAECAARCLAQPHDQRVALVITQSSGLAVVGVGLVLGDRLVAAVVAGYALVDFCESVAIARLARACGTPFPELWALARRQIPVSPSRLMQHGELLRVLGDTMLREHDLRWHAEQTAQQLAQLAHYDALTGLPNRALLAERLAQALALAGRHKRMVAVLFIDIDGFKHINDSLGHPAGDELLRAVGLALTRCVRKSDTIARQGGDEFILVLSEVAHAEDAAAVARTVIAALVLPHQIDRHDVYIGVSIGISVFPTDGDEAVTLLKHADMAMYGSKESGGNRYRFFHPELNVRAQERRLIEVGLRHALTHDELELFYQPKVALQTGEIIGAEALIRWRHPDRGVIAPREFVPIAETCGLIGPIGSWVRQEACRQARAWQEAGLRAIPVAVNVSVVEFHHADFLQNVVATLTATGLAPHYLELELTESILMVHGPATTAVLDDLKQVGVQLTIDDFGTGWSSLSYLAEFPLDVLKIDQSFVKRIGLQPTDRAPLVSAIISMGKSLGLRIIAEGVETRDQLTFLQAEACAEGQGYYFGRPVAAEQFAQILAAGIVLS